MLALQWVAYGLVLVLLDVTLAGWDVLPDPAGWLLVGVGLLRLRDQLGPGPLVGAAVALVVSVAVYPPGLVRVEEPALAWALSLPQAAAQVLLALALGSAVSQRRTSARLCGWLLLGSALAPAVVIGGDVRSPAAVGGLAFVAVASSVYLVYLLVVSARELEPAGTPAQV